MKLSSALTLAVAVAIGTAAVAHQGVENPAVLARMNNMTDMGDSVETLVNMVRGTTTFDRAQANQALQDLRIQSSEIVPLFQNREDDPASEALDTIWLNFDDFVNRANRLEIAAGELAGGIETLGDVRPALQSIGETCSGCHDIYRQE
ncbi:cytochrome c [Maritalea mobilis]|uniref:c-type cytochrome n=1 Tax=Maritalea mobilis TaxID=483324 RepID=UPI001C95C793|nr:cytochrome c [Maritalea mobilis]MBY6201550.1 cytochrome c [Maritalea mobilis]